MSKFNFETRQTAKNLYYAPKHNLKIKKMLSEGEPKIIASPKLADIITDVMTEYYGNYANSKPIIL